MGRDVSTFGRLSYCENQGSLMLSLSAGIVIVGCNENH